ncbi:GAF domain-containing sensor histidine kinase [Roseibium sp.]|uniref:GAF domain-containing sensor histidine kinase n=1 Tax=Roseibium sp. TaxID=1936156 RepID=UPI0032981537
MDRPFSQDVNVLGAISAVPSILEVVCQSTGMGFAAVARVTEDRWIACSVRDEINFGLEPGGELEVGSTICKEVRDHRTPVVIDDVDNDPVYCTHHTPKTYGLKSYISVPIILSDGSLFGTLCAISPKPAQVSQPKIIGMFKLFADMIGYHLEAARSVEQTTTALLDEQETAALREQFIAVLGHDLRNPVAGVEAGMRILRREPLTDRGESVVGMIEGSISRMAGLIDNVMDFARGRLGGGLTLDRSSKSIADTLLQVVSELQTSHPDRAIVTEVRTEEMVEADHGRLAQIFSNLIGNALMHGDPCQAISVMLDVEDGVLVFQSINKGDPIPQDAMGKLFLPFSRGEMRSSLQGLGLGLYICSQIAVAHGGSLKADSADRETTFTFKMPLAQDRHPSQQDFAD